MISRSWTSFLPGNPPQRSSLSLDPDADLAPLQAEAVNLLSSMMFMDEASRPEIPAVLKHPLWWTAEKKLEFLADVSDRCDLECLLNLMSSNHHPSS